MATLKTDLDEYLLQNDKSRSYKITLPTFSAPSFFSKNNESTPSSTNESWFEEVQKDYCTLVSILFDEIFKSLMNES